MERNQNIQKQWVKDEERHGSVDHLAEWNGCLIEMGTQTDFDQQQLPCEELLPSPLGLTTEKAMASAVSYGGEQIPVKLVLIEKLVWDLVEQHPPINTDIAAACPVEVSFERAFAQPTLVSRRYPLMFTHKNRSLTPDLYIDGWRRHFTYFVDWTRQLEPFQRMKFSDRMVLAKQRITHVGWLVHAYNSQLTGTGAICFANGAFYDVQDGSRSDGATISQIADFFGQQLSVLIHCLFKPLQQINLDFAEYVLLKAILLFREETGVSAQGLAQIRDARSHYLRALFKYICNRKKSEKPNMQREEQIAAEKPFQRMASILAMASLISTLKSVANERVQISSIFNLIEFDALIKDVHSNECN